MNVWGWGQGEENTDAQVQRQNDKRSPLRITGTNGDSVSAVVAESEGGERGTHQRSLGRKLKLSSWNRN